MKIIHVIGSVDPAKGGPQAVVIRLAAAQAALGHDVHLVSYGNPEIERRSFLAAAAIPDFGKVQRHILPMPRRMERLFAPRARRRLRRLLAGADFVHLHGVWEAILPAAAALARRRGIAYCVRPAGMLDVWSLKQKAWKKQLALIAGYRRMLDGAAFIQALNADEAQLMEPLALKAPSVVIPNGIFLEELEPGGRSGTFRRRIPALGDRRFILFLSRLHYKKGLDILAEAFAMAAASCPDVDLVVAGPDEGAGEAFKRAIAAKGLSDRVHITGPVYGREKIDAMREAECFCLPSRQEGFSVAITEALACGLPVVITDACHFPEVESSGAGLICSLDAAAVADALATVLCDPLAARAMGERGGALVRQHYTWPKIAHRTIEAYAAVLDIKRRVFTARAGLPA
ncbi:glycoside hydrolase [Phyllobacterium phragmitis]|uniref:Glycoside hydrolase n=1 Tax=Phyllobacterium phragmitis TaxID=2670329 RepID=A0A2S9IM58_9HYPH|nr:glycosyltransferase [Phyllobacterium phragmitis]PRD41616.1 glycoside hydrolase [Phyllobacterium phragmitis]